MGEEECGAALHALVDRRCVALVLRGRSGVGDGAALFEDWLRRNEAESSSGLEYRGCLPPATLLLSGSHSALEGIRLAWARCLLRPPRGYTIEQLGDVVGSLAMVAISRQPFAAVPFEVTHETPGGLLAREKRLRRKDAGDEDGDTAAACMLMTQEKVQKIQNQAEISLPPQASSIDQKTLQMMRRGPLQMLEERSHHSPSKELKEDLDINDVHKTSEKQKSVLAKLLKRMHLLTDRSTTKHVLFSAQFPPLDTKVHCHSVATQTLRKKKPAIKFLESTGSRISWEEISNNLEFRVDQPHCIGPNMRHKRFYSELDGSSLKRNSSILAGMAPADWQRYAHRGSFLKRRHKHRRSSSNSPKEQRTLLNNCYYQSTTSRSNSEEKVHRSSSSVSTFTAPNMEPKKCSPMKLDFLQRDSCPLTDKYVQSSPSSLNQKVPKDETHNSKTSNTPDISNDQINTSKKDEPPLATTGQTSSSDKSSFCNCSVEPNKPGTPVQPLTLKRLLDIPTPKPIKVHPKEISVDNCASAETALGKSSKSKNNEVLSTTIVTEETTVTKAKGNSKIVTVTSITTSLSQGGLKASDNQDYLLESATFGDKEKLSVNDLNLNIETDKSTQITDCSTSCNIVTEVK